MPVTFDIYYKGKYNFLGIFTSKMFFRISNFRVSF